MRIVRLASQRLRWWRFYLLLLVASQLVTLIWPKPPLPGPEDRVALLTRQSANGPLPGKPVRLVYRDVGAGEPVILLHGSPGAIADYRYLEPELTKSFRVIIPDLPGFGRSERWLPDYGIKAEARYVLALMDFLKLERAQLIGFSMGSGVALHVADLAPQRVASLTLCGGIGIQEGEGSGDYWCEHLKYAAGYAGLVVLPELVPHFGLLGSRSFRHTFVRSFWDTDQRPLRGILERLRAPLLILHGCHDPLVPEWVAEEHHKLAPNSEMVMFDDGHFMLSSHKGCECLAAEMAPFLARHCDPDAVAQSRTVDHSPPNFVSSQMLPGVNLTRSVGPWAQMGALFAGTFASEDLTSIAAGLLIREGQVDWFVGILACFLGIFVSDLGLWLVGRVLGRGLLDRPWLRRFLPLQRLAQFERWFANRGKTTLVAARFIPGSRTPLYLAAGVLRTSFISFALCTFVAALIWTPIFIAAVALLGDSFVQPVMKLAGQGWLTLLLAIALFFIVARTVITCCSASGRARLAAKIARLWRWEFWPMWLFYLPLIPWLVYLSVRYRGVMTWTAANPAIPQGGVVGESKFDILSKLPSQWAIPSLQIATGERNVRFEQFRRELASRGWTFPLIVKPDAAQRGAGVRLVRDLVDAEKYLGNQPSAVLVQPYHAGPFEAGIFYYRFPDEPAGHIFSITDKHFPVLVGNGRETVEELIWKHPRYRMQAKTFLARFADEKDRVLAADEQLPLTVAGNHCQGTMFCDGAHLMTPQLEQRIDEIARHYDGFFIGRFDVRYGSVEAFKAGNDLAIVELNGATSESTNIYDPSWSLLRAYRTLFRQWELLYRIGYINRQRGAQPTSTLALLRLVFAYYRQLRVNPLAD